MSLTPLVSSTTIPFNGNVAWNNSWITVKNDQNIPLYAQAMYLTNQELGQNGFVVTNVNDTAHYSGNFTTIQTLTTTRFAGLTTVSPQVIGNGLTNIDLPVNFKLSGPITAFRLQYGAVIAYKA